MIAVERAGLELVREGRSAVEAETIQSNFVVQFLSRFFRKMILGFLFF